MIYGDKRLPLPRNQCIRVAGMDCCVEEEIGRGSNAIVYKAKYPDAQNPDLFHHILLKELFPLQPEGKIYRADDRVTVISEDDATFSMHLASFQCGNKVHLRLREESPGQFGTNINTDRANNTYYTVLDFTGGRTLQQEMKGEAYPFTLRGIVRRMLGLVDSLAVFHQLQLLHLDISPDNMLLINRDAAERVELIDYNSVVPFDEKQGMTISIKEGFAAPEVRARDISLIGPWTDLYSVSAVFFSCLFGRRLTLAEYGGLQKIDIQSSPSLLQAPQTVISLTEHIIRKGLHFLTRKRYQTTDEYREDLLELLDRIDGVGITHSALWETGKRSIKSEINSNPSLNYLMDEQALYPFHPAASNKHTMEDFCSGCDNVILTGQGGLGKTTLLMRTVLNKTQKYQSHMPAMVYLSLYNYCEEETHYIHDCLLSRMKFKAETENYENARHALDVLLQKPLSSKNGSRPVLCLFLDGYNEIVGDTKNLKNEIEQLSAMEGVRILISSRQPLSEFNFENWQLDALTLDDVRNVLCGNGLLLPKAEGMNTILTNPLMLTLYVKACANCKEQPAIQTKQQLIYVYLEALLKKELDALPEDSSLRWPMEVAFRCVYPLLAHLEQNRTRVIRGKDLLSQIGKLYRVLPKHSFLKVFPQWIGHSSEILASCKTPDEWYGLIIHDLLWRKLGLLIQCDDGGYRLLHQDFQEALCPEGKKIQSVVQKIHTRKKAALLSAGALSLIGAIVYFFTMVYVKPYEPLKAGESLEYVQAVYRNLNTKAEAMDTLLTETTQREAVETEPASRKDRVNSILQIDDSSYFKEARKAIDNSNMWSMTADEVEEKIGQILSTGYRFPWNSLQFDMEYFKKMLLLNETLESDYSKYINVLEYILSKDTTDNKEDYRHCCDLVQKITKEGGKLSAAYQILLFTKRKEGLGGWLSKGRIEQYSSIQTRLDPGKSYKDFLKEQNADEWEQWEQLEPEELYGLIQNAEGSWNDERETLIDDDIWVKYSVQMEKADQ